MINGFEQDDEGYLTFYPKNKGPLPKEEAYSPDFMRERKKD